MARVLLFVLAACGRVHFDDRMDAGVDPITCAHTFCDDFDRDPPLEARWDTLNKSANSTTTLAADGAMTPGSYVLGLPFPNLESGFLEKHFAGPTATVAVAFSISYATTMPGTAEIDLVHLKWDELPAPCTSFGYYLVRDGQTGVFDLQETYGGCGGNENMGFTALQNTGFHQVKMLVTLGDPGHVKVIVDEQVIDKATSHAIHSSPLTLRIGGGAIRNMVAPWTIRYDDVIVDVN